MCNCLGCKNEVIPSQKGALLSGDVCLQKSANSALGVCAGSGWGGAACIRHLDSPAGDWESGWPGKHLLFLALLIAGSSRTAPHASPEELPLFRVKI